MRSSASAVVGATTAVGGEEGAGRVEVRRGLELFPGRDRGPVRVPRRRNDWRTRYAARRRRPAALNSRWSRAATLGCAGRRRRGVDAVAVVAVAAAREAHRRTLGRHERADVAQWSGKRSTSLEVPLMRSSWVMTGSLPGARPRPRSMRPGAIASRAANCSATTRGAWFGSITPPGADPDARRACGGGGDQHGRGGRRDSWHVVVLREPVAAVAQIIGALCQSQRGGDRLRAGLAGTDGDEVENRERGRHRRRQPRDRPPHSAAGIHRAFLTAS